MPRRAIPLNPGAGPLERFAVQLRTLRDQKGSTVDKMAAATGIPRSTLYAVLAGKRVPGEKTLVAFVEACGGDAAQWLAKRSALLEELAGAGYVTEPLRSSRQREHRDDEAVVRVTLEISVDRSRWFSAVYPDMWPPTEWPPSAKVRRADFRRMVENFDAEIADFATNVLSRQAYMQASDAAVRVVEYGEQDES